MPFAPEMQPTLQLLTPLHKTSAGVSQHHLTLCGVPSRTQIILYKQEGGEVKYLHLTAKEKHASLVWEMETSFQVCCTWLSADTRWKQLGSVLFLWKDTVNLQRRFLYPQIFRVHCSIFGFTTFLFKSLQSTSWANLHWAGPWPKRHHTVVAESIRTD